MQDTFLAALEGIGRFEGRSSFKTWLTGILFRQSGHSRRYHALRAMDSIDEIAGDTASSGRNGSRHESLLDVQSMLDSLSPDHRAVLVLRELQGLSYDEIAQTLDLPRGTVESRLFRARNQLRERFQEYNSDRTAPRRAAAGETVESRHERL